MYQKRILQKGYTLIDVSIAITALSFLMIFAFSMLQTSSYKSKLSETNIKLKSQPQMWSIK